MGRYNFKNIISYISGNYRYFVYSKKSLKWLLRKHIKEQFDLRIKSMNQECLDKGACIACGCHTPQLQMANKSCDYDCYPPLMSKQIWNNLKNGGSTKVGDNVWVLNKRIGKFLILKKVK